MIFIEHLLCVLHYCRGLGSKQKRICKQKGIWIPCPHGTDILVSETDKKQDKQAKLCRGKKTEEEEKEGEAECHLQKVGFPWWSNG